jgi:fatty-acyl-CoA synthase
MTAQAWVRGLELTAPIINHPQRIFPDVIDALADRLGDVPALLCEHERLSYRALAARAKRYARWASDQGLSKGDVVCLLMSNRPEYMAIWLGITRVGGVVALLNTNVTGPALGHSIRIVSPKHLIVAANYLDRLVAAVPQAERTAMIWVHGKGGDQFPRIDQLIEQGGSYSDLAVRPNIEDRALYLYTSGTTGLPKAAGVSHYRIMQWSHWFAGLMDTVPNDRMYNCLPMYHSVGGVLAPGATLVGGGSVVMREKFSVRDFWNDIVRWDCTLFQYIGELCRYLLNAQVQHPANVHRIRLACGNGLRPDIWEAFKSRFRIPHILEFYAATEGVVSLSNIDERMGSIGRIPPYLAHRSPIALVQFDSTGDMPVRDDQGYCVACATGEIGEALGKLPAGASNHGSRFEGYTDA